MYTSEEAGARGFGKFTGVSFEAVFQDEAHLEAVPKIFFALDADAGTNAHAGLDFKRVLGRIAVVQVLADVGQAFVNKPVDLNLSG